MGRHRRGRRRSRPGSCVSGADGPPDLVLTDVMLPGRSGLELVSDLRRAPITSRLPVIVVTGRGGSDAAEEGLAAGADDYITKPFSSSELLARVRANHELHRLREGAIDSAEAKAEQIRRALDSNRTIGTAVGVDHGDLPAQRGAGVPGAHHGEPEHQQQTPRHRRHRHRNRCAPVPAHRYRRPAHPHLIRTRTPPRRQHQPRTTHRRGTAPTGTGHTAMSHEGRCAAGTRFDRIICPATTMGTNSRCQSVRRHPHHASCCDTLSTRRCIQITRQWGAAG